MAIVQSRLSEFSLYDANGRALRARVSTGRTDYETPVGIAVLTPKANPNDSAPRNFAN